MERLVHIIGEDPNAYRLTCCDTDAELALLEGYCVTVNAGAAELSEFLMISSKEAEDLIRTLHLKPLCEAMAELNSGTLVCK